MNEIIKDCKITQSDAEVLRTWVDDNQSSDYKKYREYHTGVDLKATSVFTICPCVCTYIGRDEYDKNVVIVQYDAYRSFRYANLESVSVSQGSALTTGTQLGIADKFVHFELLTRDESMWPVRVWREDYYKQNPMEYVRGEIGLEIPEESLTFYQVNPWIETNVDYGYVQKLEDSEMSLQFITETRRTTEFEKKFGHPLDPFEIAYICVPNTYSYNKMTARDLVGYMAVVQDTENNVACYCVIGDISYNTKKWIQVSAKCGTDMGYSTDAVMSKHRQKSYFKIYGDFITDPPDWRNING